MRAAAPRWCSSPRFGALALAAAAAGIYGVMAHLVALRASRLASGWPPAQSRRQLMRLVLREGLLQAAHRFDDPGFSRPFS